MTISTCQNEPTTANPIREINGLTHREDLLAARLSRAKKAYTTRFLANRLVTDPRGYMLLSGSGVVPRPGDVVLAHIDRIGMHTRLESPVGRRQTLFVGDEVLVVYGDRYAPDQFEAEVPSDLRCAHLIVGGGLAGFMTAKHEHINDATAVRPLGLLADAQGIVTLKRLAPRKLMTGLVQPATGPIPADRPKVLGVLGTSMNSGKSTTVNCLIRGLTESGLVISAGRCCRSGRPLFDLVPLAVAARRRDRGLGRPSPSAAVRQLEPCGERGGHVADAAGFVRSWAEMVTELPVPGRAPSRRAPR